MEEKKGDADSDRADRADSDSATLSRYLRVEIISPATPLGIVVRRLVVVHGIFAERAKRCNASGNLLVIVEEIAMCMKASWLC
jgi:hypothetical protein